MRPFSAVGVRRQPTGMVRTLILKAAGQEMRVETVCIDHPNPGDVGSLRAAKDDQAPIRRFTGPEVPAPRGVLGQTSDAAGRRIQAANLHATGCLLWFVVAIEMVGIGPLR